MTNSVDQFGIEIEFASELPDITISEITEIALSRDDNTYWNIGADQTASDERGDGFELRSPIFSIFPEEELVFHLNSISKIGWINKTCGLHFHFSGVGFNHLNFLDKSDFFSLSKELLELGKPNPERSQFCQLCDGLHLHKNVALREVADSHWECRVFNSSLSLPTISYYFEKMLGILYGYPQSNYCSYQDFRSP